MEKATCVDCHKTFEYSDVLKYKLELCDNCGGTIFINTNSKSFHDDLVDYFTDVLVDSTYSKMFDAIDKIKVPSIRLKYRRFLDEAEKRLEDITGGSYE